MSSLFEHRRFAFALTLAVLVLSAPAAALAQTRSQDVPVVVMGVDGRETLPRTHELFQRVIAEIKGIMSRAGFRVVEEGAVALDLGWRIGEWRNRERLSEPDLIDLVRDMNRSRDATHGVRALVVLSIHAALKRLHTHVKVMIRMGGKIYDVPSNRFVDVFETPGTEHQRPPVCDNLDDGHCISRVMRRNDTQDSVRTLGDALANRLARHLGGSATPYTVTFRYFDGEEVKDIIEDMANKFAGYRNHDAMRTDQGARKYSYTTTATSAELEKRLRSLLAEMNFNPDEIRIAVNGTDITVEKLVRSRSRDEKAQAERLKVIVQFAAPEPPGGVSQALGDPVNAVRKVADAILARLETPVRESARLFQHLPLMALEVDAPAVMQLLRMPEVVSVQRDHPVGTKFPQGLPSGR